MSANEEWRLGSDEWLACVAEGLKEMDGPARQRYYRGLIDRYFYDIVDKRPEMRGTAPASASSGASRGLEEAIRRAQADMEAMGFKVARGSSGPQIVEKHEEQGEPKAKHVPDHVGENGESDTLTGSGKPVQPPVHGKFGRATRLLRYEDHLLMGGEAAFELASGEPCFVAVAQDPALGASLRVRRSRKGFFGRKLYEARGVDRLTRVAEALLYRYRDRVCPPEILNPVLVAFSNAILHCGSIAEVQAALSKADELVDTDPEMAGPKAFLEWADETLPPMAELSPTQRLDTVLAAADLVAVMWRELSTSKSEDAEMWRESSTSLSGDLEFPTIEDGEVLWYHIKQVALAVALAAAGPGLREPLEARILDAFGAENHATIVNYAALLTGHMDNLVGATSQIALFLVVGGDRAACERFAEYGHLLGEHIVSGMVRAVADVRDAGGVSQSRS